MKQVEVKPFGVLAEIIGAQSFIVKDVDTTASLIRQIEDQFPGLKEKKYALAVNRQIVTNDTVLEPNAIIALLPPFSGG